MVCGPEFSRAIAFDWILNVGGWLTGKTVIVKVCGALWLVPPLAVPPVFIATTVTVARPLEKVVPVKVSVPFVSIIGCAENRFELLLLTINVTSWVA